MNKLNRIFTYSSLSVLLVTIERYSFTTNVLLQPYNFMRLHEIFQMTVIILLTVIIPFLLLKEVTHNFELMKTRKGFFYVLLFIVGIYFYATGNGVHEVSSFNFNTYCNPKHFSGNLCGGFFFNDFYTGNIYYFIGGIFMIIPLLLFELLNPNKQYKKKDFPATVMNAVIYSLAIFAYAAFDTVLVGLFYTLILAVISGVIFFSIRRKYLQYPIITYTALTYILGAVAAIIVRLR